MPTERPTRLVVTVWVDVVWAVAAAADR